MPAPPLQSTAVTVTGPRSRWRIYIAVGLLFAALACAVWTTAWDVFGEEHLQKLSLPTKMGSSQTIDIHVRTEGEQVTSIALGGDIAPFRIYTPSELCYEISRIGAPRDEKIGVLSAGLLQQRLAQGGWTGTEDEIADDAKSIMLLLEQVTAQGVSALRIDGVLDPTTMTYGKVGRLAAVFEQPGVSTAPRPAALVGLTSTAVLGTLALCVWTRKSGQTRS